MPVVPVTNSMSGIGATIRIGREMLCLPYAEFLNLKLHKKYKKVVKHFKRFFALQKLFITVSALLQKSDTSI